MAQLCLNRRQALLAGCTAVLTPLGVWAQLGRGPEISQVDIMLDQAMQLRHLPLYLAQSLGYFEQEQLQVRFTVAPPQASGLEQQAALRSDVFAGHFERVLYMHTQGLSSQAFMMLTRIPGVVIGVHPLTPMAAQHPESFADLKGLRWATGPEGGSSHRVALLSLQRAGVSPHDIDWSHYPSASDLIARLQAHQTDVVCVDDLVATQLERSGTIRLVLDTRTQRDTEWLYAGPSAGVSLSASASFIERNPATIQAITQAVLRALVWMRTATPTDLSRHVPSELVNRSAVEFFDAWSKARESLSSDGVFPDGAAQNMLKSLSAIRLIQDAIGVNPAQTFNNRFAIRSRQQLRA